jgi:ring-1,2-phenylacetyl-CoA epoxidase subunit PaaE
MYVTKIRNPNDLQPPYYGITFTIQIKIFKTMVFGLFKKDKKNKKGNERYVDLTIKEIVKITDDAVNLVFDTLDQDFSYQSGQFITLIDEVKGVKIRRAYSLCSAPNIDVHPAVTVKRVANGVMSNHINDTYQIGQRLRVMEAMGTFTTRFDGEKSRQLVLIGGGSGITPLYSIVKSALHLEPKTGVLLVYANKSSADIIFKEDLNKLSKQFQNFHWINILEQEDAITPADYLGRPTEPLVHTILEQSNVSTQTHYFICGPDPMMKIIQSGLDQFGVLPKQIQIERFVGKHLVKNLKGSNEVNVSILLDGTNHELKIDGDQPILDQALLAGIDMPYSCKSGFCTACRGKVLSGKVDMKDADGLSEEEIAEGFALLCVGRALTPDLQLSLE